MAVPEQIPLVNYVADGTVKKFDVPFDYDQQADLHLFVDGVEPTIDKYFFEDNAFNFYIAPTAGQKVRIERITPKMRDTDYDLHTNTVRPKALNSDFDRIWYALQESYEDFGELSIQLQNEIIARIQADDEILAKLAEETADIILGDTTVSNDLKNYIDQMIALIIGDPSFNGINADKVLDASGLNQQEINNNQQEVNDNQQEINTKTVTSVNSIAELLAIASPFNGQVVNVLSFDAPNYSGPTLPVIQGGGDFKYISTLSALNDGGFVFNGWVRQSDITVKKPEFFGCKGDGVDDSENFKKCLSALVSGDCLELKAGATYFNTCAGGYADNWKITVPNITIKANGAWLKRRKTAEATASIDGNLAALEVYQASNVKVIGLLQLSGNEDYHDIVDGSGTVIAAGNYVRGYSSSHGLYLREAHGFECPQLYSERAVFNVFADLSDNIKIHGRGVSSGQRYPLIGSDLGLGSGIKTAYCNGPDIDLNTEWAGYAGIEIEPQCHNGSAKTISISPAYFGILVNGKSSNIEVNSVAKNAVNGSSLYIGDGSNLITGSFTANTCKFGIQVEPSATDATGLGDVYQIDVSGVSKGCSNESIKIINNASGGKLRESSIKIRSNGDGVSTSNPTFTIVNNENCSFDLGANNVYRLLDCDKSVDATIDIKYAKNIASTPMFFTQNTSVNLFVKLNNVRYELYATQGIVVGSSTITTAQAIPVAVLQSIDFRTSQFIVPNLQTTSVTAVTGSLFVDTVNSNTIKRK